jgi:large subunit ribosomal protein L30
MAIIKIKQVKSVIRRPQNQKDTMVALGLKGINQIVEKEGTPQIMGMIKKISHLVEVVK